MDQSKEVNESKKDQTKYDMSTEQGRKNAQDDANQFLKVNIADPVNRATQKANVNIQAGADRTRHDLQENVVEPLATQFDKTSTFIQENVVDPLSQQCERLKEHVQESYGKAKEGYDKDIQLELEKSKKEGKLQQQKGDTIDTFDKENAVSGSATNVGHVAH